LFVRFAERFVADLALATIALMYILVLLLHIRNKGPIAQSTDLVIAIVGICICQLYWLCRLY
jgi:hypothetical protein